MHETRGDDVFEFVHDDEGIHYHQTKVWHLGGRISNPEGSKKPSRFFLPSRIHNHRSRDA